MRLADRPSSDALPLERVRILKDVHDSGLRSRAVLVEDGAERLELVRAWRWTMTLPVRFIHNANSGGIDEAQDEQEHVSFRGGWGRCPGLPQAPG